MSGDQFWDEYLLQLPIITGVTTGSYLGPFTNKQKRNLVGYFYALIISAIEVGDEGLGALRAIVANPTVIRSHMGDMNSEDDPPLTTAYPGWSDNAQTRTRFEAGLAIFEASVDNIDEVFYSIANSYPKEVMRRVAQQNPHTVFIDPQDEKVYILVSDRWATPGTPARVRRDEIIRKFGTQGGDITQTGGVFNQLNLPGSMRLGLKMDLPYQRVGNLEPQHKQFHNVSFGTEGNGMDIMIDPDKPPIYSKLIGTQTGFKFM